MSFVEFIQIEPTTRCNFKCAFCPRWHLDQGDMDYALFVEILKKFSDIRYLQLYGEGEPLLAPNFFSMVNEAVARFITVSTISNGSLLHRNIDNILLSGLNSIHVSLESMDIDLFHEIRGGNLPEILNSLRLIIEARNRNKMTIPFLGLSVTVLKGTRDGLGRVFSGYQDLAMDGGIIVQPLNEMKSYAKNYDGEVHSQSLESSDLIAIDQELETNTTLKEIQETRRLNLTFFEALRQNFNPQQDGCPWLLRGLFVNFQGEAMPCSMIKDVGLYSFGHVAKDSMESVLEKRENMRQRILAGDIPEACKNCRTLDLSYKPGKMYQYKDGKGN